MKSKTINKIKRVYLIIILFGFYSCSSENSEKDIIDNPQTLEIVLPTLKTNEAENIDVFNAVIWSKVLDNGGSSILERGVCYGIIQNPTINNSKIIANVVKGSGEFKVDLSNLKSGQLYYAKAFARNEKGIGYGNEISFTTSGINPPILQVGDTKVAGAHDIWIDITIQEVDEKINEIGVVYSTSNNPTIADNKIVRNKIEANFKQRLTNLQDQTIYYIKSYAITQNAITYSNEITIGTIKQGNFTWSFWWEDPNADAETLASFNRIRTAFDQATWYYNNFTSIVKHVNVNYSPGTPTADANFDGWINFGANASYQKTGTAMHEMAHTVGVGTNWKYGELMKSSWQGNRANAILKMMTDDPNASIYGDAIHFWPYGINGAHEDDGSEMLYIIHALLIQGMKVDGLPSN